MMQPAARISTTPVQKIRTFFKVGVPLPAIQSAHSVGHKSNRMPIGLSKRISRQ